MGFARQKRRWLSISLRALLLLTTAVAICSYIATSASGQRASVNWVRSAGGTVQYYHIEYASYGGKPIRKGEPFVPTWLVNALGPDVFCLVQTVRFGNPQSGKRTYLEDLQPLANIPTLKDLEFFSCDIADLSPIGRMAGLKHLRLEHKGLVDMSMFSLIVETDPPSMATLTTPVCAEEGLALSLSGDLME